MIYRATWDDGESVHILTAPLLWIAEAVKEPAKAGHIVEIWRVS